MKILLSLRTPIRQATASCKNKLLLLLIHFVHCITMHHSWRWLILVMLLLSSSATSRESFSGGQHFEYDEELAKLSLIYSSATYQRVMNWTFINPDCNERTEGFILNESYVGDGTDAFGYVGLDTVGKRIVVAFKGTSNLHDWMTDLRTWVRYTKRCAPAALAKTSLSSSGPHLRTAAAAPGPDELIGNVHFGFCDYYQTLVAKGLADRIALLAKEFPSYNVFVTGHSLGAAAAAVCAADMAQRMMIEGERVMLYTLGEPRTGDGIFAEGVNDRVGTAYRIVHDQDVVPHLALCCHDWFGGKCQGHVVSCPYQHSSEIVYANDMSPGSPWVVCNDTVGEDYACDPQGWDFSVSDHKHYFGHMVGEYCRIPPEEAGPSLREEALPEEVMWTLRDDAMRREEARFRGASMLERRG